MLKIDFNRHKPLFKKLATVLSVGLFYYLFTRLTSFYIPCIFTLITGLRCPGCGITRFCISLLKLDFASAIKYNCCIAILAPIWLIYFILYLFFPDRLSSDSIPYKILTFSSIGLLLLFGILRNITPLSFYI